VPKSEEETATVELEAVDETTAAVDEAAVEVEAAAAEEAVTVTMTGTQAADAEAARRRARKMLGVCILAVCFVDCSLIREKKVKRVLFVKTGLR